MGCDIHSVIQVRRVSEPLEEGSWKTIGEGLEERNYQVFGILADVRNARGLMPISRPRGFPEDFSAVSLMADYAEEILGLYGKTVYQDYPECKYHLVNDKTFYMGLHSFSYLTAKELLKYKWDRVPWEYGFPIDLSCLILRLKELADQYGDENVRMVFGFDS
jgi:hypothetical protein